ncbi:MAG: DUF3021 family protein [Clostridia bacterium]|nr:DUF3021 family protein [Clostridia bacterium]
MKLIQFITRKILYPAGVIYILLTMVPLLFMNLTDNMKPALTLENAATFLLLAVLIAACNLLFSLRQFSLFTRTLFHFSAVLVSIVVVLLLHGGYDMSLNSMVLVVLYTVVYLLIVPPVLLIGNKLHRKSSEEKTYTSIFSPRD